MVLFICAIVGYLAIVLVYCIPTDLPMKFSIQQSCRQFENELFEHEYMDNQNSVNDIYSDAIYLCVAAEDNVDSPFIEAIKNKFNSPSKALVPQFDIVKLYDPENFFHDDYPYQEDYEFVYGRYWHGYLLYLKPLLYFFDYGAIRTILMFFITVLFAILLIAVYKEQKYLCVPVCLFYVFLNPVLTGMCLMYFPMTMLSMLFMLFVIKFKSWLQSSNINIALLFMVFGAIVNYFDMMSFPFICLFCPLILYLVIVNIKIKKSFFSIFIAVLFWAIGYFFMMGIKLLMLTLVSGPDMLKTSLSKAAAWLTTDEDIFEIIYNAFLAGLEPCVFVCSLIIILYVIYLIISSKRLYIDKLLPLLFLSLAPFAIIFILKYHTLYHLQFSYKEFAITYFALICYCAVYYNNYKKAMSIENR